MCERYERYEEWATVPLLINGFIYAGSFVAIFSDRNDPFAQVIFWVTWTVFVVDYFICLYLHPQRWKYVLTHPLTLIALIFPPLRLYILFLILDRGFRSKTSPLRDKVGLVALYVTMINIVFGSYVVWRFERDAVGADIRTYGESLWWAISSVTTVGYGDYVPITVGGRVTATIMLFSGVASIAVFTGVLVGYLSTDARNARKQKSRDEPPPAGDTVDLAAIERRLAAIEQALTLGHPGATSPGPSDAATRLGAEPGTQAPARSTGGNAGPGPSREAGLEHRQVDGIGSARSDDEHRPGPG